MLKCVSCILIRYIEMMIFLPLYSYRFHPNNTPTRENQLPVIARSTRDHDHSAAARTLSASKGGLDMIAGDFTMRL